jgi:hypothetical protein
MFFLQEIASALIAGVIVVQEIASALIAGVIVVTK